MDNSRQEQQGPNHNQQPFTLSTREAARRYSVSARTLNHWRATGMPYLQPGPRKVLYLTTDADAWVLAKFSIGRPRPTLQRIASAGVVL